MSTKERQMLVVDCVGRPFRPGMLYDYRTDRLLPGLSLFDPQLIQAQTVERSNPSVTSQLRTSTSFDDKAFQLDLSATVKASFLGGLVQLEGSASFLQESRKSLQRETVSQVYRSTTFFRELILPPTIQNPNVLNMGLATHIVTGVQYGGSAVLVFDRVLEETASNTESSGRLEASIRKGIVDVSGTAQVDISLIDETGFENVSVRYFGDIIVEPRIPTTFREGLQVASRMPTLIKEANKSIRSYLLPLAVLDNAAPKILREIGENIITEIGNYYQFYSDLISTIDVLLNDPIGSLLRARNAELEDVRDELLKVRLSISVEVAKQLPLIRGNGADEASLGAAVRNIVDATPVARSQLWDYVVNREVEQVQLTTFLSVLRENGNVIEGFDRKRLVKALGTDPGVPKIVVSVPSVRLSTVAGAFLQSRSTSAAFDDSQVSLVGDETLERVLFQVVKMSAVKLNTPDKVRFIVTEADALAPGAETVIGISIDDFGFPNRSFKLPEPPKGASFSNLTDTTATISWQSSASFYSDTPTDFLGYTVILTGKNREAVVEEKILEVKKPGTSVTFDELPQGNVLEVTVAVRTVGGISPFSPPAVRDKINRTRVIFESVSNPGFFLSVRETPKDGSSSYAVYQSTDGGASAFSQWVIRRLGQTLVNVESVAIGNGLLDQNERGGSSEVGDSKVLQVTVTNERLLADGQWFLWYVRKIDEDENMWVLEGIRFREPLRGEYYFVEADKDVSEVWLTKDGERGNSPWAKWRMTEL